MHLRTKKRDVVIAAMQKNFVKQSFFAENCAWICFHNIYGRKYV